MRKSNEVFSLLSVRTGEVVKVYPKDKKKLAAVLQEGDACVIFSAIYDNHEGIKLTDPIVVMLHWAASSSVSLNTLLSIAADEGKGIGFLHNIKIEIISHPNNSKEFDNEIRKLLVNISGNLFIDKQHKNSQGNLVPDKIPCKKEISFMVNQFGQMISIDAAALSVDDQKSKIKDTAIQSLFRKLVK